MANPENLKRGGITAEEAPKLGSKGGKKSVESRRKKKLMSQIYGAFLAEKFAVKVDGEMQTLTGEKLVNRVVKEVLVRGGGPAVSLMKEIREATEGSKVYSEIDLPPLVINLPNDPEREGDGDEL